MEEKIKQLDKALILVEKVKELEKHEKNRREKRNIATIGLISFLAVSSIVGIVGGGIWLGVGVALGASTCVIGLKFVSAVNQARKEKSEKMKTEIAKLQNSVSVDKNAIIQFEKKSTKGYVQKDYKSEKDMSKISDRQM